jgi:glutamate:GABA antiporter
VKLRYAYGHVHRPYRVPYGRCGMWFAGGLTTLWVAVGSWVAVLPGTREELFGLGARLQRPVGVGCVNPIGPY